jgi:Ca2+-transporting ATPase
MIDVNGPEKRLKSPHTLSADEVLRSLDSTISGLSAAAAKERLEAYGLNALPEQRRRTVFSMVLDQFKDFLILLLIGAAVVSGMIGEPVDTVAILVIVVLNAVIGFVQEFRAEKAMEALRKMAAAQAVVRREGKTLEIPTEQLVPGDIALLDAGCVVPADLRIVESAMLKTAEAALTGESVPVPKVISAVSDPEASLGDRRNMAYKGTQVVYGRGVGVVVATGMATELGKIAGLLQEQEEVKTPLQRRLATFGRHLGLIALAICAIVFAAGVIRGVDLVLMFLTSVSLAVAAVPEALPAVATITLALGARRMVKINSLVRRLPAVETLGSVTYICSDKTGTLTLNRMRCERFFAEGSFFADSAGGDVATLPWLWRAMALCNDASEAQGGAVSGDPTETALYVAAAQAGFKREVLEREWARVGEIPFESDRRLMTTFHACPEGGYVSFTKGAAEAVLAGSGTQLLQGSPAILDPISIEQAADDMAKDGLRVLALAMRRWESLPADVTPDAAERDMTFIGMAGLMDPPREEAAQAVAECRAAGIVPVMITGDHPATALTIARRLGIASTSSEVLTGKELAALSLEEFGRRVEDVRVYARVAPEQKVKIVTALQDRGEFVAMTGDGVNDAPALKKAEIGVAMGVTGTDVTKEAADMILLDDNFATIVRAVKEGRRIFDNVRKFIKYTMTSNSGEIWTILLAPFVGLPIPLLPIHILWINLVTDGLPGLAYAAEPGERDIMRRSPRPPGESILAEGLGIHMVWVGVLMGGVCLLTQALTYRMEGIHWQTMVFTVLCLSQLGHALAVRSEWRSFFSQGPFSNMPMTGAVLLTLVLQLATIYVPFLRPVFKTEALSAGELAICLAASSVVFWAVELEKVWKRRKRKI